MGLAVGADIESKAIFDLKYKGEESTMCRISPEPSVSPLLMGRSGRFSDSHSFTGMVSLSTREDFKTDLVKPMETSISESFLFQQKFAFASFSFRLKDGEKKTGQSTQVSVHPAFGTHLTALKITFEVKTMRFFFLLQKVATFFWR